MNLDSCPPQAQPVAETRQKKNPCLSSKSADSHSHAAKDARRRRLELRRIRSSPQPAGPLRRSSYGKISVVGRRREMDDAVAVELGFLKRGGESYDFYGVFDGREGQRVGRACSEMLVAQIAEESEREVEWEEVMLQGFDKVAARMRGKGVAGSAAVVGDAELVVAGSKAVLSRGGVAVRLLEGQVRVGVARRSAADEFLILGSDGFWDVISDDLACQIARTSCAALHHAHAAAALMAEMAVAQGSKDNVSVVLVDLRQNHGISV